jgi:hypothetical protein
MEGSGSVPIITELDPKGPQTYGSGSGTPLAGVIDTVPFRYKAARCIFEWLSQDEERAEIVKNLRHSPLNTGLDTLSLSAGSMSIDSNFRHFFTFLN